MWFANGGKTGNIKKQFDSSHRKSSRDAAAQCVMPMQPFQDQEAQDGASWQQGNRVTETFHMGNTLMIHFFDALGTRRRGVADDWGFVWYAVLNDIE